MDGNGNGSTPAAPVLGARWNPNTGFFEVLHSGLTKRELFAAMAMQGLLAGSNQQVQVHTDEGVLILPARKAIPTLSLEYADALLAALNAEQSK